MQSQTAHFRLCAVLAILVFALYSVGCSGSPSTESPATPTALIRPTGTEPPAPTLVLATATSLDTATPSIFTPTSPALPISRWKEGWVDFINGYYGYAISLPPSAVVTENAEITTIPAETPLPTPEKADALQNPFEHLNRTYPPGICVTIEYGFAMIQIRVADGLGGIYADQCGYSGGIGVGHWEWSEEELSVGGVTYPATVLRLYESDAPDAKLSSELYMADLGDGARFSINGRLTDPILLDILRSYRSVPRTEWFCPDPAPTRLKAGENAYISTEPPLTPNNVRSDPGINQDLIGSIPPGEAVELLEGPVCNNSLQWWKVRGAESGLTGWTPEGDHESYWLIVCESEEDCGVP